MDMQPNFGATLTQVLLPLNRTHPTTAKSLGVDTKDKSWIEFLISIGAMGAGATLEAKVQHSDDDVDGNYVDYKPDGTNVLKKDFAVATDADRAKPFILEINKRHAPGLKRFVRLVGTSGTEAALYGVVARTSGHTYSGAPAAADVKTTS